MNRQLITIAKYTTCAYFGVSGIYGMKWMIKMFYEEGKTTTDIVTFTPVIIMGGIPLGILCGCINPKALFFNTGPLFNKY